VENVLLVCPVETGSHPGDCRWDTFKSWACAKVHARNQVPEAGRWQLPGQPGLFSETLSQNRRTNKTSFTCDTCSIQNL
jgi:hypothetical protein